MVESPAETRGFCCRPLLGLKRDNSGTRKPAKALLEFAVRSLDAPVPGPCCTCSSTTARRETRALYCTSRVRRKHESRPATRTFWEERAAGKSVHPRGSDSDPHDARQWTREWRPRAGL